MIAKLKTVRTNTREMIVKLQTRRTNAQEIITKMKTWNQHPINDSEVGHGNQCPGNSKEYTE